MVRLFISVGRLQNVRPGDLLGAIAGETGLEGKAIGNIDVHDRFSFCRYPGGGRGEGFGGDEIQTDQRS